MGRWGGPVGWRLLSSRVPLFSMCPVRNDVLLFVLPSVLLCVCSDRVPTCQLEALRVRVRRADDAARVQAAHRATIQAKNRGSHSVRAWVKNWGSQRWGRRGAAIVGHDDRGRACGITGGRPGVNVRHAHGIAVCPWSLVVIALVPWVVVVCFVRVPAARARRRRKRS